MECYSLGLIVGIDASNIREGGGVTHLTELLRMASPHTHGISKIIVWGGQSTLSGIENRPWLVKSPQASLNKGLPWRIFWQRFRLSKLARICGCDVLFVPGGLYSGRFSPVVAVSQNLLPFEWREARRFGWSWMTFKMLLLRILQVRTFRQVDGLIFLTRYAQKSVMRVVGKTASEAVIIPHGIDRRFFCPPRGQEPVSEYSVDRPFRLLYVSVIDVYKHQWRVARTVGRLRKKGLPVALELVGPARPSALERLTQVGRELDSAGEFIFYRGPVQFDNLHKVYRKADAFVFASSCENLPNILLEAMAAGLPIACSDKGPMPEVLGEHGVYFNPEDDDSLEEALEGLVRDNGLRKRISQGAFLRAKEFSWRRCADDSLSFLIEIAKAGKAGK